MPGVRRLTMVVFATMFLASACVSVAPPLATGVPVAPATGSAPEPTAEPVSNAPATEAPSEGPLLEPSDVPQPTDISEPPGPTEPAATDSPTTSDTPQPVDKPNLVILEIEPDVDPVFVNDGSTMTITVANLGQQDAGPFGVQVVMSATGQPDAYPDKGVFPDGLAAGATGTTTVYLSPNAPGDLTITATADSGGLVDEENESDNERVLELTVASAGNLAFAPEGFSVTYANDPQAPDRYFFPISLVNTGTSSLVGTFEVRYFGYPDTGDLVRWGYADFNVDLGPGDDFNEVAAFSVDPGSYRAYALVDSDDVFQETNEDDNEAFFDFTAP